MEVENEVEQRQEANMEQEPEDICGDGGVMKVTLREGEGYETPKSGTECTGRAHVSET
jgi:hypothetical protein